MRTTAATKGSLLQLDVTDMALDGDALGRISGGYVVFAPGAIPGERVAGKVAAANRKCARLEIRCVLRPSPHRIAPRCRHFGACGGCAWQHIAYAEQLRLKQRMLASLLERVLPEPAVVAPTLGMEVEGEGATAAPWGFRNKVHFTFAPAPSGRGLVMGHYRRGSRDLIAVEECPVHAPAGNLAAFRIGRLLEEHGVPGADADCRRGAVRHLVVRASERSGATQATLVATRRDSQPLARAAEEIARGADAPESLHLNLNRDPGPFLFGPSTKRIHGPERLREAVAGAAFLISPGAFFQTSTRAAEMLVRLVLDLVPEADRRPVLDLYAGAGLFALPLARRAHRVVAVEENPAAVADGIASLRLNGLPPEACRFVRGRVEDALKDMARPQATDDERFGSVVLDPPRDGCPSWVWGLLLRKLRPARIVYVSCNPRALATDLAAVKGTGYRVERVQPVDMFPHTPHIESVTLLTLRQRR